MALKRRGEKGTGVTNTVTSWFQDSGVPGKVFITNLNEVNQKTALPYILND